MPTARKTNRKTSRRRPSPRAKSEVPHEVWGKSVLKTGAVTFPSLLLYGKTELGLNHTEFIVLLYLLDHWLSPDRTPFPGMDRLSDRLEVSRRTLCRAFNRLEDLELIERVNQAQPSGAEVTVGYDLRGLVQSLKALAPEIRQKEKDALAWEEGKELRHRFKKVSRD